ncbi:acyl-CoA dehydrogenase family protein [Thermodesulfobacteriota bacterium]
MDFEFTEEQKSLVALIKDFGKREVDPDYIRKLQDTVEPRDRIPWDILKKADEIGLRTIAAPEEVGGGGVDYLTQMICGEAVALYCGYPLGHLFAHLWSRFGPIMPTHEVEKMYLTRFMEDYTFMSAGGIVESDAGSDMLLRTEGAPIKTFAHKDGDEWVLNGEKAWPTGGAAADMITVFCSIDRKDPMNNLRRIYVPTDTPGFEVVRSNWMLFEELLQPTTVAFDNVRVPANYLIEETGTSPTLRASARIFVGPRVGADQAIYEATKEYAKMRVQGGKPIFEHNNVGPLIVEMHILVESLKHAAYRHAWEADQAVKYGMGDGRGQKVALTGYALYYLSKHIPLRLAEHACDVFAATGSVKDMPVHDFARLAFHWQHGQGPRHQQLMKAMPLI